jgi:hypothetical protein
MNMYRASEKPAGLPVAGREAAAKLLNPAIP